MRRIAWVALAPLLALIANGCSEDDDATPVVEVETGGTSTGGASSSGGDTAAGGVVANGGATGGAPASGGPSSGGESSAGSPSGGKSGSGGASNGGATSGGVNNGGATSGGRFGFGGRGGRSGSGGSGNASTGGTPEPAECSLVRDGATGDEPNGEIPVCCAPSVAESTEIEEVFNLLNEHRMNNGVGPLEYDTQLESAIQGHCLHMSQHTFFDHEAEEDGVVLPWDRARLCGTSANGENIAQGQRSPADVMEAWIDSPGHNENMLNARYSRVGIGYVSQGRYWGQLFGQ